MHVLLAHACFDGKFFVGSSYFFVVCVCVCVYSKPGGHCSCCGITITEGQVSSNWRAFAHQSACVCVCLLCGESQFWWKWYT